MKEKIQIFTAGAIIGAGIAVGVRYYQDSFHSEIVQIIQESRARYVEEYIYKTSLNVQLHYEFSEKHRKDVERIGYELWEKHGDFPYDIFRQEIYKRYKVVPNHLLF